MAYGSKPSRGGESPLIRGTSRIRKKTTKPLIIPKPENQVDLKVTGLTQRPLNLNPIQANSIKTILNREVFNKTAFNNTVNTNFTQLDQEEPDLSFFDPNLATVDDFFNIYQNLFFTIPKFGDINSHAYLVIESTEYTGFIENQSQIDALLEEIVDLREQNLQLQLDINELMGVKATIDQAVRQTGDAGSLEELLQAEADLGVIQSNSSSDNLTTPNVQDRPVNNPGVGSPPAIGGGGGNFIPGVTSGFTNEFNSQFGDPLPSFGFGGSNINPGNQVY